MLEYMELLGIVEHPDIPDGKKRGMMDVLSRITHYMDADTFKRYQEVSERVRELLNSKGLKLDGL